MMRNLGILLALIFAILGLLHVYWAFGGGLGMGNVIPLRNGAPVFRPSMAMTLLVAAALFSAMIVILGQIKLLGDLIPQRLWFWGTAIIALLFLLRAIGDFNLVGFFKQINDTNFAYWDNWLFSPLCLLISIIALLLLL